MVSRASCETSRRKSLGFLSRGSAVPAFFSELCSLLNSLFTSACAASSAAWSDIGISEAGRSFRVKVPYTSAIAYSGFVCRWVVSGVAGLELARSFAEMKLVLTSDETANLPHPTLQV